MTFKRVNELTITVTSREAAKSAGNRGRALIESSGQPRFLVAHLEDAPASSETADSKKKERTNRASDIDSLERARSDLIETVLVTAQKRQERLIDVPQSVSVLSARDLAKIGAFQFQDFANAAPGLSFQTAGAASTQITLRGVTTGFDVGPTVGVYVDEVPYGSSSAFALGAQAALDVGLFDIDRIEVLRGPQGTLYGASTMGGLLKYVSKRPDATDFDVNVQTGVSNTLEGDFNYNGAAVVNAPIVADKIAMRASGFYSRDAGYIDNLALVHERANRSDIYGGRIDLLFMPTEALSIRVGGFLQNVSRGTDNRPSNTARREIRNTGACRNFVRLPNHRISAFGSEVQRPVTTLDQQR
ncbi:MAG: TonB-dependent receptor [Steroidobacter sp.]